MKKHTLVLGAIAAQGKSSTTAKHAKLNETLHPPPPVLKTMLYNSMLPNCLFDFTPQPVLSRRLLGGVELMQAVGLKLEENGSVLALREDGDAPGAKWDRVPESVLRRLDAAAKVDVQQLGGCLGSDSGIL